MSGMVTGLFFVAYRHSANWRMGTRHPYGFLGPGCLPCATCASRKRDDTESTGKERILRTTRLIIPAALVVTLLSGCNSGNTDQAAKNTLPLPSKSSSAAPITTTPAGPSTNARGNIVKALGQPGGLTDKDGNDIITFAVDSIAVDKACDSGFSDPAENGHFLMADLRVSTSATLSQNVSYLTIDSNNFSFIGPDGVTKDSSTIGSMASFTCLKDSEKFTQDPLGNSQQYTGTIVLDVPDTHGTLVMKFPEAGGSGWEWSF